MSNQQLLIVMVGLPRSGKTTWSQGYAKKYGCPIVCPDSIRFALSGQLFNPLTEPYVWAMAKTMVRALFLSGHERVILDSTAITKARRQEWMPSAHNEWETRFKVFNQSPEVCRDRARADRKEYLIPVI